MSLDRCGRAYDHHSSLPSIPSLSTCKLLSSANIEYLRYLCNHVQFGRHMTEELQWSETVKSASSDQNGIVFMDLGRNKWKPGKSDTESDLVASANAIASRIFFDFCRDRYWTKQVQEKIQTKLATIHLPYFIETLELSNLDLGKVTPQIAGIYPPILDDWGVWIDFEMKYHGAIRLVLETRINLMKLKHGISKVETGRKAFRTTSIVKAHHYSDEELPESPESSPDEDFGSRTER
ncbi:hypothetical protein AB6A40_011222 [Gnathostoma spinigerum]|uniref:Uncharacterized protein n=1 Tax=Gnathostoma spinigerum TaxID=75299 RepID=A0ABD6EXL0_9BILA